MANTLTPSPDLRTLPKSANHVLGTGPWRRHLSNAVKLRLLEVGAQGQFQPVHEACYNAEGLVLVILVVKIRRPAAGQLQCSKLFNPVGTLSTDFPYYSSSSINQLLLFWLLLIYLTPPVCNLVRAHMTRIDVIFEREIQDFYTMELLCRQYH